MSLSFDLRGAHHGQLDCTLSWSEGETCLGYLHYAEFEGRPHIQMIRVAETHRRRGIATRLLVALQSRYPDQEIDWGGVSDDGAALKSALTTREIPSPEAADLARLTRLKARLSAMYDDLCRSHTAGACTRAALTAYYCLERLVEDLDWQLQGCTPVRRVLASEMPEAQQFAA